MAVFRFAAGLESVILLFFTAVGAGAQDTQKPLRPCEWSTAWPQLREPYGAIPRDAAITNAKVTKGSFYVDAPGVYTPRFIGGTWDVEMVIDATGVIRDAQVVRRPEVDPPWPEYEDAILKAVRTWRYAPGQVNGAPWPSCGIVSFGRDLPSRPKELLTASVPILLKEVRPQYTPAAMDAKIQGEVLLKVTILEDGRVGDVVILRSLDQKYGLDQEAIKAVKQWSFKPSLLDGKPVALPVSIAVGFKLRSRL